MMATGTSTSTEAPPCIEERYLAASNTSDLTMDADRRGHGDLIAAAGFVHNQLGLSLLHMQGEWDKCDKPRKRTTAEIAMRALAFKDKKGRPDLRRATIEAMVWHASAMRERAAKLSGRSVVVGLLTDWAIERGIDVDLISPALFHWLAPACGACEGRGKYRIPDSPALSNKSCNHCGGAGTWPRPLGAQDIHDLMKTAIGSAKGRIGGAMR
jgi:hypothetical protein